MTTLPPKNWLEAFELLRDTMDQVEPEGKTKRVLFFNEFPWMHIATGKRFDNWCGYALENLCFKHLNQIKRSLGISGIQTSGRKWRYQSNDCEPGAQIELLIERADRCFNLVEAKFSMKAYAITKSYASELESEIRVFRAKTKIVKPIFLTMITPHGIDPNRHSIGLSVEEITLQDLMNS